MVFAFDNNVLNVERRELCRDGSPVALEPQVFDFLVYLIHNRNRVVSKDDLIENVWNGRIVSESAVTTRLNAARKAIGDSGATQRLIRTVPRYGVRFVGEVLEEKPPAHEAQKLPGLAVASPMSRAELIGGKPSIAVMPFDNLGADPRRDYLAEGLCADVTTELSHFSAFFVIACNTTLSYRNNPKPVGQIAQELGVRYLVSGSVRATDARVRISVQLVDANAGHHIWAERYDRPLGDFFDIQDEITSSIVGAIAPEIQKAERNRAQRRSGSLDWYECLQKGLWHFHRYTEQEHRAAIRYFQSAVEYNAVDASAPAYLAYIKAYATFRGWSDDSIVLKSEALAMAASAVALDPRNADCRLILSLLHQELGDTDSAIKEAETAVRLNRNFAQAHGYLGFYHVFSGQPLAGIQSVRRAELLSPFDDRLFAWLPSVSAAFYQMRQYEAALEAGLRAVGANADYPSANFWTLAALGQLGRGTEAESILTRLLRIAPPPSRYIARYYRLFKDRANAEHLVAGLRLAGWTDQPGE